MQNNSMKGIIAVALVAVLGIAGFMIFSGSDDAASDPVASQSSTDNSSFPLDLDLASLAPLEQGIYEGWVVRGDEKISFGTFNTNENSEVVGEFDLGDVTPENGDTIAISIEPVPDTNPEPSETIVLAGELENGSAALAFPVDTTAFSGQYILATPSDDPAENETAGIWFVDPADISASLDLPIAPTGWAYEGWVVSGGTPISTGLFTDPAKADFAQVYYTGNGPSLPGEDFFENLPNGLEGPLELADGETVVVISLEPFQDNADPTGDKPAQVKPLTATIPANATDHSLLDLNNSVESVPSGSATVR